MKYDNEMQLTFPNNSLNEALARTSVAAFALQLSPTVNEITDIKTAVSEAVTNAIIHGYEKEDGEVNIKCGIKDDTIYIEIKDNGIGILNLEEAKTPLYTSKPDLERSGMGFTIMETFMDYVEVRSEPNAGTTIFMHKKIVRG